MKAAYSSPEVCQVLAWQLRSVERVTAHQGSLSIMTVTSQAGLAAITLC